MQIFGNEKVVKNHIRLHRVLLSILLILMLILKFLNIVTSMVFAVGVCLFCLLVIGVEIYFEKKDLVNSFAYTTFKGIELFFICLFEYFCSADSIVMLALILLSSVAMVEFVMVDSQYDKLTIGFRKSVGAIIILFMALFSYANRTDDGWGIYFIIRFMSVIVVIYFCDYLCNVSEAFDKQYNKVRNELMHYEDSNAKLLEYQDRVKETNEQINFQRIELTRAYKELEQANIEIESQTEIMKYLTSTFDVQKCINVVAESIIKVKDPKLCSIFIDKDVYYNKYSSCTIKTNYASMQRRLKKDIENIYEEFKTSGGESVVIKDYDIKRYRFIGDTNINSLAFLPLCESKKIYGMMILASDQEDFFDSGLSYYENCIIEFGVSIKSTKMYLKMEDMAKKDGLTGIYNRLYFTELFAKASSNALRKNSYLSVALYDIDKFKSVNDTYGHLAGDLVIKMVSSVGQKYCDEYEGFCCRYGGEEFLMVFPDKDENETLEILEKMHEEIRSTKVVYSDTEINVNVCIGLSSFPGICHNTDLLISRADAAMYYGKRSGRGRLVLDNPSIDNS